MKATWIKIRERFGASFLFKVGILTMPAAIALGGIAVGAGLDQRMQSNPQYWAWLVFAVAYIGVAVGTTVWGWFSD